MKKQEGFTFKTENQMMTVAEAARYQNVSRGTIDMWIRRKYLAYEQLPSSGKVLHRFIRIRKQDLDAMKDVFHNDINITDKNITTKSSSITVLPKTKKSAC